MLILAAALVVAAPWVIVFWVYRHRLTLEPARFLEECAKFGAALVVVGVSFALIQVHWTRREQRRRRSQLLGELRAHLAHLDEQIEVLQGIALSSVKQQAQLAATNVRLKFLLNCISSAIAHPHPFENHTQCDGLTISEAELLNRWASKVRPLVFAVVQTPGVWRYTTLSVSYQQQVGDAKLAVSSLLEDVKGVLHELHKAS